MLFGQQKRRIQDELGEFREAVMQCVTASCAGIAELIGAPTVNGEHEEMLLEVRGLEGKADRLRRSLEVLLYSKSLFPESRGDLLGLLEHTDRVANSAEAGLVKFHTFQVEIPEELRPDFIEFLKVSERCVATLLDAQESLFVDFRSSIEKIGRINELESAADEIERRLLSATFRSSSIKGYRKILIKELIETIASISDRAENVGDRLRVIVAKRGA